MGAAKAKATGSTVARESWFKDTHPPPEKSHEVFISTAVYEGAGILVFSHRISPDGFPSAGATQPEDYGHFDEGSP